MKQIDLIATIEGFTLFYSPADKQYLIEFDGRTIVTIGQDGSPENRAIYLFLGLIGRDKYR